MNDFELNRVKWARECLRKFMTGEEAKKADYGFVVMATEYLQELLSVVECKPKPKFHVPSAYLGGGQFAKAFDYELPAANMVRPTKDRAMRLAFLRLEGATIFDVPAAIVWDDITDVGYNVQGGTNEEVLNSVADRMGWRSKSYIDAEHDFPVTEVWREE